MSALAGHRDSFKTKAELVEECEVHKQAVVDAMSVANALCEQREKEINRLRALNAKLVAALRLALTKQCACMLSKVPIENCECHIYAAAIAKAEAAK